MFKKIKILNDKVALSLAAVYGAAITIWAFAAYSLIGAFVSNETLNHMLYWSNAAQLVFCPLSVYVANLALKSHIDSKDRHEKLTEDIKKIHDHLGINGEKEVATEEFMI